MAFKILPKIKPNTIQNRELEVSFLKKYYKHIQQAILKQTTPENPTDYYFCLDYIEGLPLFIAGNHAPAYKKVFKETAKGKHGFEKTNISIGRCFVLRENGKSILCVQHNSSASKGKKGELIKAFKKLNRTLMKQFSEVRWIDGAVVTAADDENDIEVVTTEGKSDSSSDNTPFDEAVVKEVETRLKQLQQGMQKLKNDVIPRLKTGQQASSDVAFVQALRKAGQIVLSKMNQTDDATANKLKKYRNQLEKALPQWTNLELRLTGKKDEGIESGDDLKEVVSRMNAKRKQIKELLKRVNLKALS